ncbi:hypothetical protein TraAM80_03223 [Trypanosoma rangeli]|uniref:Transmembrane protein n=1 Tax=Trypanosoma rangeli TaxID=5698 RepID=A0A422NQ94_TRYRA|nr:uncharacterized protein TraAM80_03223 [Trypanosoma rangeli]RNF07626.1 hypothetical protein TraAM80_03223 [Trypanosoma rangeli]|eukprot:RNF07626.1 hypothetical protein TraAM80_03223 [Trypanosoma rangeli]
MVMTRPCVSGFGVLLGFLLVLGLFALLAVDASRAAPTEIIANVCPTITLTDHLSALFGHDTDVASSYCVRAGQRSWDARQEFSLRWEMERWIRANRTAGMFPESYQFVRNELRQFTTLLQGDEPLQVRQEKEIYAKRANATLREMPWLLVPNSTFAEAQQFYHRNVRQRPIIRSYHLSRELSTPRIIHDYLQEVTGWWAEAEKRVSRDPRVAVPLLPQISLDKIIGPPITTADIPQPEKAGHHASAASKRLTPMSRRSFRFSPPRRPLPTALVYYYTEGCVFCEAVGVAFDILPLIYRRLCESGHHSVVSCSPLLLFFRARGDFLGKWLPTVAIYGVNATPFPVLPPYSSYVAEIEEFEDPVDFYGFREEALFRANMTLPEILEQLVGLLEMYDVIQLRKFSSAEVAELGQLVHAKTKQNKWQHQQKASMGNAFSYARFVLSASDETRTEGMKETKDDLTWQYQHMVKVKAYLHSAVMVHMWELWGNSTAEVETKVPLNWSQLEIPWVVAASAVLSVVWLVVFIYATKRLVDWREGA